jgi:hypothetical protein
LSWINNGGTQVRVTFAAGAIDTPITKAYIGITTSSMTQANAGPSREREERQRHEAKIDE